MEVTLIKYRYGEKKFESSVLLPEDQDACRGVPPSARYAPEKSSAPSVPSLGYVAISLSFPSLFFCCLPNVRDSLQKSVRISAPPSGARRVESSPQQAPRRDSYYGTFFTSFSLLSFSFSYIYGR
jgi:hypothetical protein